MASYTNCKVSDLMPTADGSGFHILGDDDRQPKMPPRPLVTLAFKTWDETEQARDEVAKAVAKAVTITPHS